MKWPTAGRIFLDEIGELDARMQVKLLRVLDGVPYFRLGGVRKVAVDARVVAATNRDLNVAVAEGRFRGDLHHRLQQFVVCVPPLRERVEDIAPLARHFLQDMNPRQAFTAEAIVVLESRAWPGNILSGIEERRWIQASLVAKSEWIQPEDVVLPGLAALHQAVTEPAGLNGMERRAIIAALAETGGHQARAAAQLGISRRTLSRRLRTWDENGVGGAS